MRRRASFLALCAALFLSTNLRTNAATIVDGYWEGAVSRLGSVQPVSIELGSDVTGKLGGTYTIPELGLFQQPLDGLTLSDRQLTLHMLYGTFTLEVHPESAEITGLNAKWNPVVDMHVKRALAVKAYRQEEVTVRNGAVRLVGTLYRPLGEHRAPLLVVVPGSDDRGRGSFEYRGYGPMLAVQGVAVFVYDKRGIGASTHSVPKPTFDNYASDARSIVAALRRHPGIDSTLVGLGGASQGGWIAPLAALHDLNVAFLVLLSGPAVSVERQELDRVDAAMVGRNASAEERERARAITQAYFDVADGHAPLSTLEAQYAWLTEHKPEWADVLSGPDPGESLSDAAADWRRLNYDPANVLTATRIPLLAVFGSADDLVTASDNVPLMRRLVGSNNPHNRIVLIDGANHALFMGQHLQGGDWRWPTAWWVWDRRAPDLIQTLVSWIHNL